MGTGRDRPHHLGEPLLLPFSNSQSSDAAAAATPPGDHGFQGVIDAAGNFASPSQQAAADAITRGSLHQRMVDALHWQQTRPFSEQGRPGFTPFASSFRAAMDPQSTGLDVQPALQFPLTLDETPTEGESSDAWREQTPAYTPDIHTSMRVNLGGDFGVDSLHAHNADRSTDVARSDLEAQSDVMCHDIDASEVDSSTGGGAAPESRSKVEGLQRSLVFGCVNAVVLLPVMLSFTVIIFRSDFFAPHLGMLVKLVVLGSAIHQLIMCVFSTLPFAVGQVQDVGLIFLSVITTSTVERVFHEDMCGVDPDRLEAVTMGTSLVSCSAATLIVGALVVVVGKLKLAALVQYIPFQVVGSYLGFVGYFCVAAGLSVATQLEINNPLTLTKLVDVGAVIHLIPAVGSAFFMMMVLKKFHHPLAFPIILILLPSAFFLVLTASGASMADAQAGGWLPVPQVTATRFWEMWDLFNLVPFTPDCICWASVLRQVPVALALFMVVAFGSSMDVAAIQTSMPEELDYNKELVTVGISNALAGLVGAGFTGSYIFSQTCFNLRAGVTSRLSGWIIVVSQVALVALPFSIIQYFPNFFLGSLMMLFGTEILVDWLWESRKRCSASEYKMVLLIFVVIMTTTTLFPVSGLEFGIFIGIIVSLAVFAWEYAAVSLSAFSVVPSRSSALRAHQDQALLQFLSSNIIAVSLDGYIFFGSSVVISDRVKDVAHGLLEYRNRSLEEAASHIAEAASPSQVAQHVKESVRQGKAIGVVAAASAAAPKFLLLDFRKVSGLDATGAATFGTLSNALSAMGIEMVVTHTPPDKPHINKLLESHNVVGENACRIFNTLDSGLQYCEGRLLKVAQKRGLLVGPRPSMGLEELLRYHLEGGLLTGRQDAELTAASRALRDYLTLVDIPPNRMLFDRGDNSEAVYLVKSGLIVELVDYLNVSTERRSLNKTVTEAMHARKMRRMSSVSMRAPMPPQAPNLRRLEMGPGCVLGELDFFLQRPRSFMAFAGPHGAKLYILDLHTYRKLAQEVPHLCTIVQSLFLHSSMLGASYALEALERSTR